MGNKLYVGNLSYNVRDDDLQQAFAQYGTVSSAKVMMDRDTGRSKGFGFVEMGSDPEAQAAINGMNGQALDGRAIVVNEARPREERPGGFGGGSRGGPKTTKWDVPNQNFSPIHLYSPVCVWKQSLLEIVHDG